MSPFGILKEMLLTEKSNGLAADFNRYTFKVASNATKHHIAAAVESTFSVKVAAVNVLNTSSKHRRARTRKSKPGKIPAFKKAVVSLREGNKIEVM
jgi:large subunit ribosomal protein L23